MKTRKILALILAVLMAVGCLAACGGETKTNTNSTAAAGGEGEALVPFSDEFIAEWGKYIAENEGTEINLTLWAPSKAMNVFQAEADKFADLFKDHFKVNITVAAQEEGDAAAQVILAPDKAADVFSFPSDQLNKLIDAQAINNVDMFAEEIKAANTASSVDAATINGSIYAYPETGDNSYFLCYDKRFVTDEQAKSLETILAACKDAGKKFTFDSGNGYFTCVYLYTGGVQTLGLEEDGITQKFNDYNIDDAVATTKAFAELFAQYKGTFENISTVGFADGVKTDPTTVAAGVIGSWDVATVKSVLGDNAGFAILPTINVNGTDKQMINMFGYKFLGVNKNSKAPYAAQLLAFYLSGEECQQDRAEKLEWGPSNTAVQASEFVQNNVAMKAILAQSEYSMPQVGIANTFWDPLAGLGKYVAESTNDFSDAKVKEQVEACIANIKDE